MMELRKIILIDDDKSTNFYNSLIIEEMDIPESKILEFTDPEKAYQFLLEEDDKVEKKGNEYTAVLLDLNMPKLNGWELIDKVKAERLKFPLHYHLGILTASLNQADQERAENTKCVKSFLEKPLTEEKISRFLEKAS